MGTLSELDAIASGPGACDAVERGGARRDRTADLLHAMQALSQLSYGPGAAKKKRSGSTLRFSLL
jgi:hypothetical protein